MGIHMDPWISLYGVFLAKVEARIEHERISAAIDASAHAARTHVRRSIGQQFRRAREQLGLARPASPPNQEHA